MSCTSGFPVVFPSRQLCAWVQGLSLELGRVWPQSERERSPKFAVGIVFEIKELCGENIWLSYVG